MFYLHVQLCASIYCFDPERIFLWNLFDKLYILKIFLNGQFVRCSFTAWIWGQGFCTPPERVTVRTKIVMFEHIDRFFIEDLEIKKMCLVYIYLLA